MNAEPVHLPGVEALYLEYRGKVRAYARHHLRNEQDAEDAVSQVFLNAHKNWDAYDPARGSHSTWLYAITRNVVRDMLRRSSCAHVDARFDNWEAIRDTRPLPEDALILEAEADQLAAVLLRLPERERDILLLRFYSGLPSKEVAARMNLSDANVRYLQSKAIARLRKIYEGE